MSSNRTFDVPKRQGLTCQISTCLLDCSRKCSVLAMSWKAFFSFYGYSLNSIELNLIELHVTVINFLIFSDRSCSCLLLAVCVSRITMLTYVSQSPVLLSVLRGPQSSSSAQQFLASGPQSFSESWAVLEDKGGASNGPEDGEGVGSNVDVRLEHGHPAKTDTLSKKKNLK